MIETKILPFDNSSTIIYNMSQFQKSSLTVNGNSVHVAMPFAKVDKEKRLVSGFATLDNLDTQGDVVLAEASAKAFSRARGNIREMHQPIAAGKIVDFKEDEFYDQTDNKFYRGMFVTAYVSEGAEDTWKKVLDGTLTGFSIGGEINDASNEFVKEAGKTVRFIKDYDLVELSLVDNPANQLANVFSIQKSASGSVMKGMLTEVKLENVFYCVTDNTIIVSDSDTHECPMCDKKMENAGWFESGSNRAEKVQAVIAKFLNSDEQEAAPISESEGGVEVTKSNTKSEEVVEPVAVEEEESESAEEVNEVEESDAEVDKESEEEGSESPEEVEDESAEISKKIDELHEAINSSLDKSRSETAEQVAALEKKIDDATDKFLAKASELESKMGEFGNNLKAAKNRLSELENNLEKYNSADALRKSADVETPANKNVQNESFWGGAFSG